MNKYLPSKKFVYILISIISALCIVYISYIFINKNKTNKTAPISTETIKKAQEFISLDTDGDGLKDWEEALWKTDPKNKDTDGDGTNDGEEILLNRDPLKPNINPPGQEPSDKIDEKIIAAEKKAEEEYSQLTATEMVARQLFSQYIATKKIGGQLTETDKFQIIENSIINLPQITFKKYTEKDLVISNASDNESLKNYSNSVAEILLTNLRTEIENIDTIITDFSNITDDTKATEQTIEIFKRFTPLILKSQKTVSSLLKVTVPKALLNEHLNLLNSFEEIYESVDLMQKSATDLVTLIPLINHYEISTQTLGQNLEILANKILSLNITYINKTDFGYQFFNVIMFRK
jgi:hypothetical protein